MPEVAYVYQLPRVYGMLDSIPVDDKPENEADFWLAVAIELANLIRYAAEAKQPEIVMTEIQWAGSQYQWLFWVNDLAIPQSSQYNWHGQNVSQWVYAGAIVLEDGKVSRHH